MVEKHSTHYYSAELLQQVILYREFNKAFDVINYHTKVSPSLRQSSL